MFQLEDLDPIVVDWLKNSQDPKAIEWRDRIYKMAQYQIWLRSQRQIKIKQEADTLPHDLKIGRRIGILDEGYHADLQHQFEERGGVGKWFSDPEFLADTKKKNPQLFV